MTRINQTGNKAKMQNKYAELDNQFIAIQGFNSPQNTDTKDTQYSNYPGH